MSLTPKQLFDLIDGSQGQLPMSQLVEHMQQLEITLEDIRYAVRFDEARYARNLFHAGRTFHAMILCWKPGQASPIHDHRGSKCGVRVMQGECSETIYSRDEVGLLKQGGVTQLRTGEVCASCDSDIHKVFANANASEPLITLHIYSPPLQEFGIYSTESPLVESFNDPFFVPCRGGGI